jgi:hypothetical protein
MKYKIDEHFYFLLFLGIYHLFFVFISFEYVTKNGGDSFLYWFQTESTQHKSWLDFFNYGTDAVLFLNYLFAKVLSIPFFFGFVLYALIGFFGFVQLYRLALRMMNKTGMPKATKYLLYTFLLLPNTHFWTALIGKEAIIFAALSTLFLKVYQQKFTAVGCILSFLIILVVRPHLAFMGLFTLLVVLLFSSKISFKQKTISVASILTLLFITFYMFLQLAEIERFDWERMQRFNLASLRSFEGSGSFVSIESYSYPMKLFAFYFRPFFENIDHPFYFILSIENGLLLALTIFGLMLLIKYRSIFIKDDFAKFIVFFCLIGGILFTQRYSGLGIFVRTKIMFLPYLGLLIIAYFHHYYKEKYKPTLENQHNE